MARTIFVKRSKTEKKNNKCTNIAINSFKQKKDSIKFKAKRQKNGSHVRNFAVQKSDIENDSVSITRGKKLKTHLPLHRSTLPPALYSNP